MIYMTRKERLQKRQEKKDFNVFLNGRTTRIHKDFWDRFVLLAQVCYHKDHEADLFDAFDTMRTKLLGGQSYSEEHLTKLDKEIDEEIALEELVAGIF